MRTAFLDANGHTRRWFDIALVSALAACSAMIAWLIWREGERTVSLGFASTAIGVLTSLSGGPARSDRTQAWCRWIGLLAGVAGLALIAWGLLRPSS